MGVCMSDDDVDVPKIVQMPPGFGKYLDKKFYRSDLTNELVFNKKELRDILEGYQFDDWYELIINCVELLVTYDELSFMMIFREDNTKDILVGIHNETTNVVYIIGITTVWIDDSNLWGVRYGHDEFSLTVNDDRLYKFKKWGKIQKYFDSIYRKY